MIYFSGMSFSIYFTADIEIDCFAFLPFVEAAGCAIPLIGLLPQGFWEWRLLTEIAQTVPFPRIRLALIVPRSLVLWPFVSPSRLIGNPPLKSGTSFQFLSLRLSVLCGLNLIPHPKWVPSPHRWESRLSRKTRIQLFPPPSSFLESGRSPSHQTWPRSQCAPGPLLRFFPPCMVHGPLLFSLCFSLSSPFGADNWLLKKNFSFPARPPPLMNAIVVLKCCFFIFFPLSREAALGPYTSS